MENSGAIFPAKNDPREIRIDYSLRRRYVNTRCVFSAVFIMFFSMAAGELLYDQNLFRGFLRRPEIWPAIVLETAIAALLVSQLGLYLLRKLIEFEPAKNQSDFQKKTALVWLGVGLILVALYWLFYWPREWRLTAMAAGLFFGWILPGVLTLAAWTYYSRSLYKET